MSTVRPKRIFDVMNMKTCLYEDIGASVVRDGGYVIISHVWGDQKLHRAEDLGIKGVTWLIPLSDREKLDRILAAMKRYKMRFMWFDVVCMPQGKGEEEIERTLEIPNMGDYYAGAKMTLVLATEKDDGVAHQVLNRAYSKGNGFLKKIPFGSNVHKSYVSVAGTAMGIDSDKWLERKWTFQEAVLSREMKYVGFGDETDISLTGRLNLLAEQNVMKTLAGIGRTSADLAQATKEYHKGGFNLGRALYASRNRICTMPEDKFYGLLGVLGYKDFVVGYGMDIEALNMRVIEYAYNRGDVSWMGISVDGETGFIQQIHRDTIRYAGGTWKEEVKGSSKLEFGRDGIVYIDACAVAAVTDCVNVSKDKDIGNVFAQVITKFGDLKYTPENIVSAMTGYRNMPEGEKKLAIEAVSIAGKTMRFAKAVISAALPTDPKAAMKELELREEVKEVTHILQATSIKSNKSWPLVAYGDCDIGDRILLLPIYDDFNRALGIIVDRSFTTSADKAVRKGICLYPKGAMPEDELVFTRHEFLMS